MIEITIRLKTPAGARAFAALLRTTAGTEPDPGQARIYRGAARQLEHTARPWRYTMRVQRPTHTGLDEEAVQRVVLGLRPYPLLSTDEARAACSQLTERDCSITEIADRLSTSQRTVSRWRAEARQAVTAR